MDMRRIIQVKGAKCGFPVSSGYEPLQRVGATGEKRERGSGWDEPGQVGREGLFLPHQGQNAWAHRKGRGKQRIVSSMQRDLHA